MTTHPSPSATETQAPGVKPFTFAAAIEGNQHEGGVRRLVKNAQLAEEYGYDGVVVPDHLGNQAGPFAALGALAASTKKIRLGTSVLANPLRHPVVVAKESTTVDVLSGGRFELGIGAGWIKSEFDQAGIEFLSGPERLAQLEEALIVLDVLLRGQEVHFKGKYYQVDGIKGTPRPRQGPRPPIAVGGGGPKILKLAAKYADTVSIATRSTPAGKMLMSDFTLEATQRRVEIVKEAAGERFKDITLNWALAAVVLTDDRESIADMAISMLEQGEASKNADFADKIEVDRPLTKEEFLNSPYLAIGTAEEIADQLRKTRAETGLSFAGVFPTQMEAFSPVVEILKGE
jgi:probable F420-dependent oxidoreductase